jgi:ERCC4-type nuclease
LNIIASIPFIGEKYAERLLKNFKTIKNIKMLLHKNYLQRQEYPIKLLLRFGEY